jgi:hypothetical protein
MTIIIFILLCPLVLVLAMRRKRTDSAQEDAETERRECEERMDEILVYDSIEKDRERNWGVTRGEL